MNIKNTTIYAGITAMLFTVAALGSADIYMDLHEHQSMFHVFLELAIICLSLAPALYLLRRWRAVRRKALDAQQHLEDYLQGLGRLIERELTRWELTEAEKKTALFILRGLSHKEIAEHCHRSEGTVRQHAVAVYRKAGLTSRAEFAAYFLQKLLLPIADQVDNDIEETDAASDANPPGIALNDIEGNGVHPTKPTAPSPLVERITAQ